MHTIARCVLLLALLVHASAGASAAGTRNVAEWAEALTRLSIQGPGVDAASRSVEAGGLKLALASGRLFPVRAGGDLVGAFFVGSGNLRHTSSDRYEKVIRGREVERASTYTLGPGGAITDAFSHALLLVSDGAETLLGGGEAATAEEAPAVAREAFAKHVARFARDRTRRYPVLLAGRKVEGSGPTVTVMEIEAVHHDLLFVRDPVDDEREVLSVMEPTETKLPLYAGTRLPMDLSVTSTRPDRLDPPALRFVLTSLDVDLRNPEGDRAELTVRETIEARVPLRVVELRLWSAILGTVGITSHPKELTYEVSSVKTAGGDVLPYVHRDDSLLVELPQALKAGESVELRFEIKGDVLYRPGGDNFWYLVGAWYPTPRSLSAEGFRYHAVIRTKKPFVPFSNGSVVRRFEEGELAGAEFLEEKPIQYAAALAGKYTTYTETREGFTVRVSTYAIPKEDAKKKLAGLAFGLLHLYEPLLGKYPFRELQIVEINDLGWGQAPAGIVFITKEAFSPIQDEEANEYVEGINFRFAHELAHGWWGHVAKLSEPEDEWLSESAASYYAAFVLRAKGKSEFDRALAGWRAGARGVDGKWSVYLANRVDGKDAWRTRQELLYDAGPLVLHGLRAEVGDDPFFTIMKSYLTSFPMKPASTKSFIALSSFIAKRDLRPWFDRHFFGTEIPKVK